MLNEIITGREVGMSVTERVINDLNEAKLILCNPQMLTPEMCIRVGLVITRAIDLLKEREERIKKFELERSWDEYPDTMGKW
jgi:DNA topoisomerase IA